MMGDCMSWKCWLQVGLEFCLGVALAYALSAYALLAFWANKWVFNDVIAVAVIVVCSAVSAALMYGLHRVVSRVAD